MQSLKSYQLTPLEKTHIMELITSILKKKSIIFAYIHGSFLKESFRDVDLAIYLEKPLEKKETLMFELEMERELEKAVNFPVDVRILNHSPPYLFVILYLKKVIFFSVKMN